jgi:stringent starvation protein B
MMNAQETPSTRPYLVRAMYEWCTDNGFTPYVAVRVDDSVRVPREYVKNGEIVLNISFDATSSLKLGNEFIEFKARFAGVARDIMVPLNRVIAIYARESGQGMAFPTEEEALPRAGLPGPSDGETEAKLVQLTSVDKDKSDEEQPEPPRPAGGARPALKRVK